MNVACEKVIASIRASTAAVVREVLAPAEKVIFNAAPLTPFSEESTVPITTLA